MYRKVVGAAALGVLVVGPQTAGAEVTAPQVWDDWRMILEAYGTTLEIGGEEMAGDTLIVTGLVLTPAEADDAAAITGTIDELRFHETGEGTVEIAMDERFPMTFRGTDVEGQAIESRFEIRQKDLVTVASGEPGAIVYDYTADEVAVAMTETTAPDAPDEMTLDAALSGITGHYGLSAEEPRALSSGFTADALTIAFSGTDSGNGQSASFQAGLADIDMESEGDIVPMEEPGAFSAALEDGFSTAMRMRFGPGSYHLEGEGEESSFALQGAAESGFFDLEMDAEGLTYAGGNTGTEITLSGAQIPLPQVTASIAKSEARLTMPVLATETDQEFGLRVLLDELDLGDAVWGLVDPDEVLPRDPARLLVDISGRMRWLLDIFDPTETADVLADAAPAVLDSVTLNRLELSAAGAELSGEGAFLIDNEDMTTFEGAPKPVGSVELRLEGADALLDDLIAMGLLPQDQAMGARMMMGLFAQQAEGEDALVSEIEITEEGHVLANGQRIR